MDILSAAKRIRNFWFEKELPKRPMSEKANAERKVTKLERFAINGAVQSAFTQVKNSADGVGVPAVVKTFAARRKPDYLVADLIGRCFLRVCFWIDACVSWAKKYHPLAYTTSQKEGQLPLAAISAQNRISASRDDGEPAVVSASQTKQ